MIFTIEKVESRVSRVSGYPYLAFKLKDDYEHIRYAYIGTEVMLNRFHKRNGIYWGDREPSFKDYEGLIITGSISDEWYAHRYYERVHI